MSKNIAISDEVYEKLKREKGEKSFSEVIEEKIDTGGKLKDVSGSNVLTRGTLDEVKEDLRKSSSGSIERIEDEVA
ncbi:MAG: antitoxin VapB family protein [Candidatus Nanohaloarchaea archaeon]